jgi:hypothetical protein
MDISLPPEAQGVIIGLFWGLVIGLFFYQNYRKSYYWWYSLFTGVLFATLAPRILSKIRRIDAASVEFVMLQILLPGVACLLLNIYMNLRGKKIQKKKHARRRRKKADIFVEHSDKPQQ